MTTYDPFTITNETLEITSIIKGSLKGLNEIEDILNLKRKITLLGCFFILTVIIIIIILIK